jgi:hypothetical protein
MRPVGSLTVVAVLGKTSAGRRSQQGMSTQAPPTRDVPAPCGAPGPAVDVIEWRFCRLCEAGFPRALAGELSRQPVDLHALLQLVDSGCPPALAARIMSPDGAPEVTR